MAVKAGEAVQLNLLSLILSVDSTGALKTFSDESLIPHQFSLSQHVHPQGLCSSAICSSGFLLDKLKPMNPVLLPLKLKNQKAFEQFTI